MVKCASRISIPKLSYFMFCDINVSLICFFFHSGESVPVTKTPLPHVKILSSNPLEQREEQYKPEQHKRHTLFNGTKVIQTRYYGHARVLAVVARTGSYLAE